MEPGGVLEALEVEAGHDGQFLHGQLLCGFLGENIESKNKNNIYLSFFLLFFMQRYVLPFNSDFTW